MLSMKRNKKETLTYSERNKGGAMYRQHNFNANDRRIFET